MTDEEFMPWTIARLSSNMDIERALDAYRTGYLVAVRDRVPAGISYADESLAHAYHRGVKDGRTDRGKRWT